MSNSNNTAQHLTRAKPSILIDRIDGSALDLLTQREWMQKATADAAVIQGWKKPRFF